MSREQIKKRVIQAAEEALYKKQFVCAIDIFLGMGTLTPTLVEEWRKGKIRYLERVVQGSLNKISFAMKCFRSWAKEKGLNPRNTVYRRKTSGGKLILRFSKSGLPQIEKCYYTLCLT